MIEAWLDLPPAGVFAVLIGLYGAAAALIAALAFGGPLAGAVKKIDGVVAPFFGAVGILFALMAGFLAGDIGERNRQAARAIQAEAAELRNVFTLSVASASDMRDIRTAWTAYLKAAVGEEWQAMTQGAGSATVDAAYDNMLREVSDPRIATEAGAAVQAALLNAAVKVGTARSERLALASDNTSELKWSIVLILGMMTQIAVGIVHLQKRGAHIAALTVFSMAAVVTLGLIALQEHPFAGGVRLGPGPLQDLLALQGPSG